MEKSDCGWERDQNHGLENRWRRGEKKPEEGLFKDEIEFDVEFRGH